MNIFYRSIIIPHLILFFTLLPVTRVNAFTVGEEKEVGEKLLYAVRSHFELIDDPDLQQYLEELGREVIGVAGVQFFDYHFFIIENKEFNAFAAPSGLIFFHSGLIEKMESENELVSVLAHEIGHIAKRHISSRIDKNKKISIATMGLILASLALGGGAATEALFAGSMAAGQSASLHFSRLDEEEADLLAYDWMKKLRRNPEGQVRMLKTMRQIARYRSTQIPQYLLTHPNPEARLDYVQTLIDTDPDTQQDLANGDDFDFLRFKYRIMAQTKDTMYFRGFLSSLLSSDRAGDIARTMAYYGLSQLSRAENNFDKALEYLDKVIAKYGDRDVLQVDRGIIEYESGQLQKAYSTLSTAYTLNRDDLYAAYSLARVCFSLGKMTEAENHFKSVMYALPEYTKVYFDLGRLSASTGKTGHTKYYLGKYYLSKGQLSVAKKNFEEAKKSDKLPPELDLDVKRSLDLIERLEKK